MKLFYIILFCLVGWSVWGFWVEWVILFHVQPILTNNRQEYDIRGGIVEFLASKDIATSSEYRQQWLSIIAEHHPRTGNLFRINHANSCKEMEDLFLLVLVKSAVGNFQRRMMWRTLWGAVKHIHTREIKIFYVTALTNNAITQLKLEKEDMTYGDIIQVKFLDDYVNNTYKVLSSFEWMKFFCPNARHVMSADDDVMVFFPRLVAFLNGNRNDSLFGGYFLPAQHRRTIRKKWFVKYTDYPHFYYADYIAGFALVLSGSLVPGLLDASASLPFMFHVDDAYLGICALKIGVQPTSIRGFELFRLETQVNYRYDSKKYKSAVVLHGLNDVERITLWHHLEKDFSSGNLESCDISFRRH